MVCVAAMFVFGVQTAIVAVDRIEHALEIDHAPNALAGTIQCTASADACQNSDDPSHPVSHAHGSDTAMSGLDATVGEGVVVEFTASHFAWAHSRMLSGLSQHAPERPPKA